MDRKMAIGVLMVWFLLMVCFLAVATKFLLPDLSLAKYPSVQKLQRAPAKTGPFDFYKLSIQWPKSYCNTGSVKVTCGGSMKQYFTIQGLWPKHHRDTPVKSYSKNPRCATERPTPPESIVLELFNESFREDMKRYWPNLGKYESDTGNLQFWKSEWEKHGMCSAYPTDPLKYFDVSVSFIKHHEILRILAEASITPGDHATYRAYAIANAIRAELGVIPDIHCNKDSNKTMQLLAVRICWDKENKIKDCPRHFTGKCSSHDIIRFP